eukprot:scaffold129327_cov65-Phaeocystis_antarctica.AAC.5
MIQIESHCALLTLAVAHVWSLVRVSTGEGARRTSLKITNLCSGRILFPVCLPWGTMRVARATRAGGSALWRLRPRGLATAAVCTKLGAPLELQHDWQLPPLGPTDVRVRIAAAGVNYADLLQACA